MATSAIAARAWPALSEHKQLRFATIFLLYVAQGLPLGFFHFAIPAWLAANGVSAAGVGLAVSAATLPWSLKLVHGFIMDRWSFLAMGRRRGWLIAAQLLIVATMVALALRGAAPTEVAVVAAFAFTANLFTTVQDVAIDGMAIDLIPEEERGRANGFMFGGQALGMAIGTTMTGFALAYGGMKLAALLCAAIVALPLILIMVVRERPGERLMPWLPGSASAHALDLHAGAWKPILLGVFRATFRRDTLLYLAAAFTAQVTLGIFYGLAPLMGTRALSWDDADVSALTGTGNLAAAFVCLMLVGWWADRLGAKRMTMFIYGLGAIITGTMYLIPAAWSLPLVFSTFVVGYLVVNMSFTTSICAIAMRLCDPRVGATQFGLFMAASNLGISAGAATLGTLDKWGGVSAMLLAMGSAFACSMMLLAIAKVGR